MKIDKDFANCMPTVGILFMAMLPVVWKNDFAFYICTILLFFAIIIYMFYLFTNNTSGHDVINKICSSGKYNYIYASIAAFSGLMVTVSTATSARTLYGGIVIFGSLFLFYLIFAIKKNKKSRME